MSKARTEDASMDEQGVLSAEGAIPNRRNFFRNLGMAAAGTAVVAATGEQAQAFTTNDQDDVTIFNYLLNLKFLLAEFYTVGLTGNTIAQMGVPVNGYGVGGPTTGGRKIPDFHSASRIGSLAEILTEISYDEISHIYNFLFFIHDFYSVDYDSIPKSPINLDGWGFGFGSYQEFLTLGRMLEDLIVSAGVFLAPGIHDSDAFDALASMLTADGEHVGNLRAQIASLNLKTKPMDCVDIIPPVGPGGQPFVPNSGNTTAPDNPLVNGEYFSTSPFGFSVTRNPDQVLYLLYGNSANSAAGGFFPDGISPYFYSTTSGNGTDCSSNPTASPLSRFNPKAAIRKARPAAQVRTPRSSVQNHSLIVRPHRTQPGVQKIRPMKLGNLC